MLCSWKGRPLIRGVETVQVVQSFACGELVQVVEVVEVSK